jgi:damage-control phosphatase, subfamily I
MKTYLDCIPCFFKQGLASARILGTDEKVQKHIVDNIAKVIPSFPLLSTPPEMGKIIYDIIKDALQKDDPFRELKQKSNSLVLEIYGDMKKEIQNSSDRLLTSLNFSIAGNIIDYGANHSLKLEKEIESITRKSKKVSRNSINFQYAKFKKKLEKAGLILFIGDNAGEIALDKLFVEEIKRMYPGKRMVYAVREKPVINDATLEDARFVGLDKTVEVISSGSIIPGTSLKRCNKEFISLFKDADIIISKGQGNFETLSDEPEPIFFLLTVKCGVVAKMLNAETGDIVLKENKNGSRTL